MSGSPVTIIDSGGANLASLQFALQRLDQPSVITVNADQIRDSERIILPGVGAARNAMDTLRRHSLLELIQELTQPVLGICLGMQLLCDRSEEDEVECLGVIPGTVTKLPASIEMPVPNMGWSPLDLCQQHTVLNGISGDDWFYFVHSYALPVGDNTVASSRHVGPFSAVIAKDNFIATQFHPERSSAAGARILSNFLRWQPCD